MPLKVSSQGWVKVPAPKKPPRKRYIDPEEEKEALCSPLRYFACQAVDPTRERLRMLGDRVVYSADQEDYLRPGSRLERTSSLDEWRHDVAQPRSSSRLSGKIQESSSPPRNSIPNGVRSSNTNDKANASRDQRHGRTANGPIIISRSPPHSVYDEEEFSEEDVIEVEKYADHVSVVYSETPSEKNCKHKHRHRKPVKAPSVIPEEDEADLVSTFPPAPAPTRAPTVIGLGEEFSAYASNNEPQSSTTLPHSAPVAAQTDTWKSRAAEVDIPDPIPESHPVADSSPTASKPRSERSERSDTSSRSSRSSRSSKSSSTARSRDTENSSSSASSYTESVRSASPVRKSRHKHYDYRDDRTESSYPSPPSSPPPTNRKRFENKSSEGHTRSYRDRSVTAPIPKSRPSPALSESTWTSSSSLSSRTRSSAPSIDGYQFQAAIFQPKNNYRGYRAPSLSKGNRWETATSALSFD